MTRPDRRGSLVALGLALGLLFLLLIQPNHPGAMTLGALQRFPLELPVIVCLMLILPAGGTASRWLRIGLVGLLGALFVLRLADLGTFIALDRRFNLVYDSNIPGAGWHLLKGNIGTPLAALSVTVALAALVLLLWGIWWALGQIARWQSVRPLRGAGFALILPVAALAGINFTGKPFDPPGMTFTASVAYDYVVQAQAARRNIAALKQEAATDPIADIPADKLLSGLGQTDVLLTFVESYGRTTHDNPLYAGTIRPTLQGIEADLAARGLAMRSGWLTSPTLGGQSWLAHSSMLSGLWIENQGRYDAMLRSQRRTLLHLAQAAGRRTLAVVPAISMAWPEAKYFGYDAIYASGDLGYKGKPFNWVTMPDQFTLSALERLELGSETRAPVFAEIALISSHAPWTPIPGMIDWDKVGDGTIFNPMAEAGDPPDVVWLDNDRVRDQYRQAIDYSLRAVGSFAARHADAPPLMIILGDHQPATFVSLEEQNRDVPVHVIGAPEMIARLDDWGWSEGLLPAPDLTPWKMDEFRARFVRAFSETETRHAARAADQ